MVKKKWMVLFALLLFFSGSVLSAQSTSVVTQTSPYQFLNVTKFAAGPTITSNWAFVTPTLDGLISAGEWVDAATFDISNTATVPAGSVTMYVKNDGTFLYIAVDDTNDVSTADDSADQVGVYFDDVGGTAPYLNDNLWTNTVCGNPTGEGAFFCGNFLPVLPPVYEEWISGGTTCTPVTPAPGITQGVGISSGHMQYEVRIDLSTSALNAIAGQVFGFRIISYDGDAVPSAVLTGEWPLGSVASDPNTFGNLILAQLYYVTHETDFNGDGSEDVSVFRPSNGTWYIRNQFAWTYGTDGDIPVPGDYNGLGQTDIAVWRPSNGTWYIRYTETGLTKAYTYGTTGDVPVPGDYNGDGTTDIAVWRPSNGTWYVRGIRVLTYGTAGDYPAPGDADGDGTTDFAVWRPSNGTWYVYGQGAVTYGTQGDIPVPGDYDGDGMADGALWRPSNGTWYVLLSDTGTTQAVTYGQTGDLPVPGDYDGDGTTDIAVFRPSNGIWYVRGIGAFTFGTSGDYPGVN